MHVVLVNVISLSLVVVSMFLSGFLAVYHTTLVASPAFSFMSKKAHGWLSAARNFKTSDHEISPINDSASGYVKVDKHPTPSDDIGSPENRPQLDNTTVTDSPDVSVRTLEKQPDRVDLFRAFNESDYGQLQQGIINAEIAPVVRAVKDWLLKKRLCLTDTERQKVATQCLKRLHHEQVLMLNPEQGKTNKIVSKYILNLKADDSSGDRIGAYDIETRCGECGAYDYTRIDDLLDRQKGIVHCSGCSKNYVAQSHLTSDSKSITESLKARAIEARKAS
jgi:hypothetical protein